MNKPLKCVPIIHRDRLTQRKFNSSTIVDPIIDVRKISFNKQALSSIVRKTKPDRHCEERSNLWLKVLKSISDCSVAKIVTTDCFVPRNDVEF